MFFPLFFGTALLGPASGRGPLLQDVIRFAFESVAAEVLSPKSFNPFRCDPTVSAQEPSARLPFSHRSGAWATVAVGDDAEEAAAVWTPHSESAMTWHPKSTKVAALRRSSWTWVRKSPSRALAARAGRLRLPGLAARWGQDRALRPGPDRGRPPLLRSIAFARLPGRPFWSAGHCLACPAAPDRCTAHAVDGAISPPRLVQESLLAYPSRICSVPPP